MTTSTPVAPTVRRNLAVFVLGESVWGFQAALVASATVLVLLLRSYGAGERMIGTLSAIETAALILPQAFGMYLFHSPRKRKRRLVLWHLLVILPFMHLMGATVLWGETVMPRPAIPILLILLFGCYSTGIGVVMAAWLDWMACLFPQAQRGLATGLSFGGSACCATVGGLLAGWIIRHAAGTATYGGLYLAAGSLGMLAMLCFFAIREPEPPLQESAPPSLGNLLRLFRHSLADRNFRDFLVGRTLATAGFSVMPFVALFFSSPSGGGLADGIIIAAATAATAMTALCNLLLGHLGDRHGHRVGIIAGTCGQLLALLVMLTGHGLPACIMTYAAIGVTIAAAITSHTNMMFETCPHNNRLAHLTVGSLVMSIATVSGPLLAGIIAQQWGLRTLFGISALISLLALAWLVLRVRDPRTIALPSLATGCEFRRP